MIKYRGPFDTQAQAEAYVESVAGQGVPLKEYESFAVPSRFPRHWRALPPRDVIFAVYDDPSADWPDEHPEFDGVSHCWTVARPDKPGSAPKV